MRIKTTTWSTIRLCNKHCNPNTVPKSVWSRWHGLIRGAMWPQFTDGPDHYLQAIEFANGGITLVGRPELFSSPDGTAELRIGRNPRW